MRALEAEGRAIVIRPTKHISKFERDTASLREYYRNGYLAAQLEMKRIKGFFG
jgi:predicted patatin/cPLA2 family phospholipase